jgi:tape measure domain-containing protein
MFDLKERATKVMKRIRNAQKLVEQGFENAQKKGVWFLRSVNRETSVLDNGLRRLRNTIIGVFAIGALSNFAGEVRAITGEYQAYENAINFASGSSQEAARNQVFLNKTISDLKLPQQAAYEGFQLLAGSMKDTELQGQATRDIYRSVSVAARAMNLTNDQSRGAFLALSQMMSKGKVQAEELRGQLGERIPGAFQIAARAMGMTTAQLDKMLETGQVTALDFLPKFAKELERTFSGALPEATQSLRAQEAAFENYVINTKRRMGQELQPVMTSFYAILTQNLKQAEPLIVRSGTALNAYLKANETEFSGLLKTGVSYLEFLFEHRKEIVALGKIYLGYRATLMAYNLTARAGMLINNGMVASLKAYEVISVILTTRIRTMKDAMAAFNLVTKASPVGLIVGLLTAAGAAYLLFRDKVNKASAAQERFNKLNEKAQEIFNQGKSIDELFSSRYGLSGTGLLNLKDRLQGRIDEAQNQRAILEDRAKDRASIAVLQNRFNEIEALAKRAQGQGGSIPRHIESQYSAAKSALNIAKTEKENAEKLSKVIEQSSNQLGIITGLVNAKGLGATPGASGSGTPSMNDADFENGLNAVAAGGKRVTHVNLRIDKMVEEFKVVMNDLDTGATEIEEKVLDVMTRAVRGALQTVK